MHAAHFFERAAHEGRRYGQDPLVFLRELAQNARDAGARAISVTVDQVDGVQRIRFTDDGCGMALDHARSYLFRLYASSKEDDEAAAGHFGVGFWSVLLWEPSTVTVESRSAQGGWCASVDIASGQSSLGEAEIDTGTRVTILRPVRDSDEELQDSVARALSKYCRYLRCTKRKQERVEISVNGRRIDEPLDLPGPLTLSFRKGRIQGVIGLAETPRVELFARGLLVKKVTVLEELIAEQPGVGAPHYVGGLSPVVIINSDDLDVVMSRQSPLESKALEKLMKLAERRLQSFIKRVADRVCPVPWTQRLRDSFSRGVEAVGGGVVVSSLLVSVLLSAAILLLLVPPNIFSSNRLDGPMVTGPVEPTEYAEPTAPTQAAKRMAALMGIHGLGARGSATRSEGPRTYQNIRGYQGPRIDDVGAVPQASWQLRYRALGGPTPRRLLFKALTLGDYDTQQGWVRGQAPREGRYQPFRCRRNCIEVTLQVDGTDDDLIVPVPTGYRLEARSVSFDGRKVRRVFTNRYGEPLVRVPKGRGTLRYRAGPTRAQAPQLEAAPELPGELRETLAAAKSHGGLQRGVNLVSSYVAERVDYDVSAKGAEGFDGSDIPWAEKVLEQGRGDCDVKNGVNVMLLRGLGVPSYLAVGIPAAQGLALPGLHAWTEYHLGGRWRERDVSLGGSDVPPVAGIPAPMDVAPSPGPVAQGAAKPKPGPAPPPPPAAPPTFAERAEGVAGSVDSAPPPAPSRPPSISPQGAGSPQGWMDGVPDWLLWGLLALLGAVASITVGWLRKLTHEQLRQSEDGVAEQRALARILKDALSQPMSWRSAGNLWYRRLLPTLGGPRLSVAEAAERSGQGGLWVSSQHSELARAASRAGTPVLDGTDDVFGDVIRALGRAVDIDAIDPVRPSKPRSAGLGRLLRDLEEILFSTGSDVRVVPCEALPEEETRDVDLSRAKVPRKAPWLKRYVAFHPRSAAVRRLEEIGEHEPQRALLLLVEWLVMRSDLLGERRNLIRERAAVKFLRGAEVLERAR